MSDEAKKQLIRYLLEDAFSGNFAPLQDHGGLQESIPMLRQLVENTIDRDLTFPLQFVADDWIASVVRRSYTVASTIFAFDASRKQVTYDVLYFHHFDGDEISLEYSQADVMSAIHQIGFDMPGASSESRASYPVLSHHLPDVEVEKAVQLVRTTIERIVHSEGDFGFLENHPAYEVIIPDLEMRKAMSPDAEVTFPLMFSDGEWVACRSYWKQSFVGEMFGIQANGKSIEFETLTLHRIIDEKIVAHHEFPDIPSMMRQLGTQSQNNEKG